MQKNQKSENIRYSIGEAAQESGVKVPTIRFYEQIGLLEPPQRSAGNRREYGTAELERLRFIRHARELGFNTADIRELLTLAGHPSSPCERADEIATRHLLQVEERIAQLQALRLELEQMLRHDRHGKVRQCQVIRALNDHRQCLHEHHDRPVTL